MLSYARGFSLMVLGSGTRGTHHELEKLFTEGILLEMVLMIHEVLKGQHHAV
jgi:hypothetical protein